MQISGVEDSSRDESAKVSLGIARIYEETFLLRSVASSMTSQFSQLLDLIRPTTSVDEISNTSFNSLHCGKVRALFGSIIA